jgi:hypothetical protein
VGCRACHACPPGDPAQPPSPTFSRPIPTKDIRTDGSGKIAVAENLQHAVADVVALNNHLA